VYLAPVLGSAEVDLLSAGFRKPKRWFFLTVPTLIIFQHFVGNNIVYCFYMQLYVAKQSKNARLEPVNNSVPSGPGLSTGLYNVKLGALLLHIIPAQCPHQ